MLILFLDKWHESALNGRFCFIPVLCRPLLINTLSFVTVYISFKAGVADIKTLRK
jgi:hypothetical protein